MKLFEYAIILQPKLDKDGEIEEAGQILVTPQCVLAEDQAMAELLAAQEIPSQFRDKITTGRIELAVKPF